MNESNFWDAQSTYLDAVKKSLAERGIFVHSDMTGPSGMYEVFENGIATMQPVSARTITTQCSEEDVARFLSNQYKHVAFYLYGEHKLRDAITGKEFNYHTIRFAGW